MSPHTRLLAAVYFGNLPRIHTVERLQALRPGQTCIYYRGDLEGDIARCGTYRKDGGAPRAEAVLKAVRDTAADLSMMGKVKLARDTVVRKPVRRTDLPIVLTVYSATAVS